VVLDWDADKAKANLTKHGVPFEAAEGFDFSTAFETIDDRFDYGEERWMSIGYIERRLHVLVYIRRGAKTRVISLRRANARERKAYAQAKA